MEQRSGGSLNSRRVSSDCMFLFILQAFGINMNSRKPLLGGIMPFLMRWIFGPTLGPNIFSNACSMFAVQFEIPLCAIRNLMSCDESYMLMGFGTQRGSEIT